MGECREEMVWVACGLWELSANPQKFPPWKERTYCLGRRELSWPRRYHTQGCCVSTQKLPEFSASACRLTTIPSHPLYQVPCASRGTCLTPSYPVVGKRSSGKGDDASADPQALLVPSCVHLPVITPVCPGAQGGILKANHSICT